MLARGLPKRDNFGASLDRAPPPRAHCVAHTLAHDFSARGELNRRLSASDSASRDAATNVESRRFGEVHDEAWRVGAVPQRRHPAMRPDLRRDDRRGLMVRDELLGRQRIHPAAGPVDIDEIAARFPFEPDLDVGVKPAAGCCDHVSAPVISVRNGQLNRVSTSTQAGFVAASQPIALPFCCGNKRFWGDAQRLSDSPDEFGELFRRHFDGVEVDPGAGNVEADEPGVADLDHSEVDAAPDKLTIHKSGATPLSPGLAPSRTDISVSSLTCPIRIESGALA